MAEAEADDGAAGAKLKSKKKLIVIAGGAAALLLLGGGGAYFMLAGKGGGEHGEARAEAADGHGGGGHGEAAASPAGSAAFIELPEMTVNLAATEPSKQQYVRMTVALEVANQQTIDAIKPLMPRVLDSFQTHLREMRPADLRGSSGVYRLKEELLRRVNVAIAPARADAVLFKDIVVQ